MSCASIKINPGASHISENLIDPDYDNIRRTERRWKRWNLKRNESLKHNCCASATRIAAKSRGNKSVVTENNGYMVKDDVDEEYKMFLDKYVSSIEVDRDNDVDGSVIDSITGYNDDGDDDSDPQYKLFLENLRQEGKSYVFSVIVGNQLVHIRYEEEEEEEEEEEGEGEGEGEAEGEEGGGGGGPVESLPSQETERAPCNKRPSSEVSSVPKNNCNSESELVDVDEDYRIYLKWKNLNVRQNSQISDQAINTPIVQCDIDQDYQILLNPCRKNGNTERGPCNKRPCSEVSSVPKNNCNSESELDVDEDYRIYLKWKNLNVRHNSQISDQAINTPVVQCDFDPDYLKFLNPCRKNGNTQRGPCNKRPRSEVSSVPKNNCNSEEPGPVDEDYLTYLKGKNLSVGNNSQISDQAINTPVVQFDFDQDYPLFLNSARIIDGNSVDMHDRNITKKYSVEAGSNASDPDLILIEPHQICENSPFISSKKYDASWFENVKKPRDSGQFPACDQSLIRRRLMEYLEKPYDQKEYDEYMQEVHCRRHRERHRETRHGVVKPCLVYGVIESHLERYPGLAKAIAEFKEPHRVLFLLRGFMFWLQNVSHDGIFRPWVDESCLEILRKM